jgi:hypothetical protein
MPRLVGFHGRRLILEADQHKISRRILSGAKGWSSGGAPELRQCRAARSHK